MRRRPTCRSRMCLAVRRSAKLKTPFAAKDLGVVIARSDRDHHDECDCWYRSAIESDLLNTFSAELWLQWDCARELTRTWTAYGDPRNAKSLPVDHLSQPWLVHSLRPDPSYLAPCVNLFHNTPRAHY